MVIAKFWPTPKEIAKILKKAPFASFSFVQPVSHILKIFGERLSGKKKIKVDIKIMIDVIIIISDSVSII